MSTTTNHGIHCVPSSKYPLCEESGVSTINNPVVITPPPGFTGKALTVNGDLDVTGIIDPTGLVFDDQPAVPQVPAVGEGTLWVRDDAPTSLIFTNSAGTDIDLSAAAVGATLTSTGGTTLVVDGVGPTLSIKGLTASGNASITDNGTDLEVVAPVTTLTSAGGTETLVNDGTGPTLATKGITAGTGISLVGAATDLTITNSDPASGVTLASAGGTETLVVDGTGPTLTSKGLTAGANITLTPGATDVTIAAASGSGLSTIDIRTVSGAFAVPAGVTVVTAYCQGGGGGGGSGGSSAVVGNEGGGGGGGAAGDYTVNVFTTVPLEALTLTVGAGGGSNVNGGDTLVERAGTDLARARGGRRGLVPPAVVPVQDGGAGGDGAYGGGGGGRGTTGGGVVPGTGGKGTYVSGDIGSTTTGGDGAPGVISPALDLFAGGVGGAPSGGGAGGGGGGGAPTQVPDLSTIDLVGAAGNGGSGNGVVGGTATRLGAGGGGGSGAENNGGAGAGGPGAAGYIVLVY